MRGPWKTHRGDEWWYDQNGMQAFAGCGADIFSIDEVQAAHAYLTSDRLHRLLWETWQQFPEFRILLSLINAQTSAVFRELSEEGRVRGKPVESPFSKDMRILDVQPLPEEP